MSRGECQGESVSREVERVESCRKRKGREEDEGSNDDGRSHGVADRRPVVRYGNTGNLFSPGLRTDIRQTRPSLPPVYPGLLSIQRYSRYYPCYATMPVSQVASGICSILCEMQVCVIISALGLTYLTGSMISSPIQRIHPFGDAFRLWTCRSADTWMLRARCSALLQAHHGPKFSMRGHRDICDKTRQPFGLSLTFQNQ